MIQHSLKTSVLAAILRNKAAGKCKSSLSMNNPWSFTPCKKHRMKCAPTTALGNLTLDYGIDTRPRIPQSNLWCGSLAVATYVHYWNTKYTVRHTIQTPYYNWLHISVQQNQQQAPLLHIFQITSTCATCNFYVSEVSFVCSKWILCFKTDVACEEHNLLETKITLLKTWTLPDRHVSCTNGSSSLTSPCKTVHCVSIRRNRTHHSWKWYTSICCDATSRRSKLNANFLVAKLIREKYLVLTPDISRYGSYVECSRNVSHLH